MIDHIGMPVSDIARATEFYLKALAPLGIAIVMQVSAEESGHGARGSASARRFQAASRSSGSARASGSAGMSMWPSSRHRARRSMPSIAPRSRPAARTTARLACGRIITPIITAPSCSISTATISRRCVTPPRSSSEAVAHQECCSRCEAVAHKKPVSGATSRSVAGRTRKWARPLCASPPAFSDPSPPANRRGCARPYARSSP